LESPANRNRQSDPADATNILHTRPRRQKVKLRHLQALRETVRRQNTAAQLDPSAQNRSRRNRKKDQKKKEAVTTIEKEPLLILFRNTAEFFGQERVETGN